MDFWTVMIILYSTSVNGVDSAYILYPSQKACGDALEVIQSTLHDPDAALTCRESDVPSRTVRPKKRPENFGN